MVKKVGLICLIVVCFTTAKAQTLVEYSKSISEYSIRNYGVDEGINGTQVLGLLQDENNFLWIISTNGILRFDGLRLFPYKNDGAGGSFYDMVKYKEDSYLFSLFGSGIQILQEDSLSTFLEGEIQLTKSIVVDSENRIYAGSYGDGLFIIEEDSVVKHINTESGLINDEIWKLFLDSKDQLWIATNDGISVYANNTITNFSTENGLPDFPVRDIKEFSNGEVWAGFNGGGIAVFSDNKIVRYITDKDVLKNNFVYSINENKEDKSIWVGHKGDGGITKITDSGIEFFTKEDGLISDKINEVYFLKDGEVGVATDEGLSLLVPKKVNLLTTKKGRVYDLETVLVKQDSSENIWVGSYSDGFSMFDGSNWINIESPPNKTNGYTQSSTVARNGDVWFGTQGSGIIQVRGGEIVNQLQTKNGLSDDYIRGLQFDDDDNLWVCTNSGIDKLGVDLEVLRSYNENDLPNSFCTTIIKNSDGAIWAGTFGGGVVKFDGDSVRLFDDKTGLKSNQVISLYSDKNSDIWVGTLSNGLARITSDSLINIGARTGVPQVNYAGFKEDNEGNFWMATGNGIVKSKTEYFQKYLNNEIENIPFQLFVKEDGMLSDNMQTANNSTIELLNSGDLLFASTSGVVVIDPEKADYTSSRFFPYIASVSNDGKSRSINDKLEFEPESKVQISFSALNFTAPYKTEFRIKLDRLDEDWIFMEDRTSVFYDYLPDGDYEFLVSAKGPDGQWSNSVAKLNFIIFPPFYKTWWFYLLAILMFTGLVIGLMQFKSNIKVKKLNRELLYQQKLHQEKERISRDLHDNVGSQITNLITGIEISNMHIEKGQQNEAGALLKNLDEDARNTMTDLRETIWLLDKEQVYFSDFEKHVRSYIRRQKRYFRELKINVESKIGEDFILDPSQSLNLMRIIQEALNNTRKYAEAKNVFINFDLNNSRFTVSVSDDGNGMDINKAMELGNGLKNMKSRAEQMEAQFEIASSHEKGTEIMISFELNVSEALYS
jgi:signal transduction histidine kinase/ligand-binding sensor domain-containing protein